MAADEVEVVVVGAGPAGSAAALHLARAGHEVLLIDRAEFPREKPCGEGLMPHGVDELVRLDLLDEVAGQARPFVGIAYHVDGISAVGRFPEHGGRQGGLGVRRWRLDAALVNACRAEPRVEVRSGRRVKQVRSGSDGVHLSLDEGEVRARAIVGADGLVSQVRKQLGLEASSGGPQRYGARVHLRVPPERVHDVVDVYVGPRCEFYLTPTGDGELNLAVLCGKEVSRSFGGDLLGGLLALTADVPALAELLEGAEPLDEARLCGPLRQRTTGLVTDRAVLVGDAAGFVDAITGEGMSLAMASARFAAEALSAGLRSDRLAAADLRAYERARRAFARDLTWLTELVLWWLRHPRLARHVVGNLALHPETFGRMLAVNAGQRPLTSIGPRDWLRVAIGL